MTANRKFAIGDVVRVRSFGPALVIRAFACAEWETTYAKRYYFVDLFDGQDTEFNPKSYYNGYFEDQLEPADVYTALSQLAPP